jgi:hypothetical protein
MNAWYRSAPLARAAAWVCSGREPETNEERQGLDRDPNIALKPLRLSDQPIESAPMSLLGARPRRVIRNPIAASAFSDLDLPLRLA